MIRKFTSIIIILFLLIYSSDAKAWIGFYLAPNCTFYPMKGNARTQGRLNTGIGLQGGFLFITNTSHIASFRIDVSYSWSGTKADIHLAADDNKYVKRIEGNFNFYCLMISPKIQFNILSEKCAFISFGISPRLISTNGNGTAIHSYSPDSRFNGKDFNYLFKRVVVAANIGIGYQEIKIGSVTLFAEINESYDISTITYTYYTYPWRALTTSLIIGIRMYKNQKYSNEYN